MKDYTDNPLFNSMANMVDTMTWDEQLEEVEFNIAHLEHTVESAKRQLEDLNIKKQEICGELGHDWDEGICILCGLADDRDWDEPEEDL